MAGTDKLSAADWIDRFARFWGSSLGRLDAHLAAVPAVDVEV